VLAAAAVVWANVNLDGRVFVVIPNELLLSRDRATF